MTVDLSDRVAFVTGAGSGLGAAFARRLARSGAMVVAADINADAVSAIAAEVNGSAAVLDVTDPSAFDVAVDEAFSMSGRLDILVNNAGIAPTRNEQRQLRMGRNRAAVTAGEMERFEPLDVLVDLDDEEWDRMIRTHLYGTFHGMRAALRHMTPARSGAIVNVASVAGIQPSGLVPSYSAAKAGVVALTRSVGQEVAPLGIRVNAVCPGWVDTPMLVGDEEQRAQIRGWIPTGRFGEPEEVADVLAFLVSDEASYVSGAIWTVAGGFA